MPKKSEIARGKKLKPCEEDSSCPRSAEDKSQFTVPKDVEDDKKVKEKDVFEGKPKAKPAPKKRGRKPKATNNGKKKGYL